MARLFLIFLLVVAAFFIGILLLFRNFNKFLANLFPRQSGEKSRKPDTTENVIYEKDDIVVLKGEADTKDKDKNN